MYTHQYRRIFVCFHVRISNLRRDKNVKVTRKFKKCVRYNYTHRTYIYVYSLYEKNAYKTHTHATCSLPIDVYLHALCTSSDFTRNSGNTFELVNPVTSGTRMYGYSLFSCTYECVLKYEYTFAQMGINHNTRARAFALNVRTIIISRPRVPFKKTAGQNGYQT